MVGTPPIIPKESNKRKDENRSQNQNSCLLYWRIYFNFGFYLCVIPFRFKYSVSTGLLEKYENSVQKVLSVFGNSLGILATVARLRSFNFKMASDDPNHFFHIFPIASDLLYNLTFIYVFWMRSSFFSAVFENFQSSTPSHLHISAKATRRKMFLAIIFCLLFAGMILSHFTGCIFGDGFDELVVSYLGFETKFSKLLIPPIVLSTVYFEIMMKYSELIVFFTIFGLYEYVSEFQSSLIDTAEPKQILSKYRNLKYQSVLLNKAIWPFVMTFLISSIPFYVSALSQIFSGRASLDPLAYLIYSFGFLCLAASINQKMDALKDWVQRRCRDIEQADLIVTLNDLTPRSTVGLSVAGLFPINYNFLGSMAGLLLTYIIVVVQMKMSSPSILSTTCPPCLYNLSGSENQA